MSEKTNEKTAAAGASGGGGGGGGKSKEKEVFETSEMKFPIGLTGLTKCTTENYNQFKHAWAPLDGSHIIVRAPPNYPKLKKKAKSGPAMFECIHVDGFVYEKKLTHISKHFIFPEAKPEVDGIKPYLVCNWLLPSYAPEIPLWGSLVPDGVGWNMVCVFRLTDAGREMLVKGSTAGARLVKKFLTCEENDPLRERLKAIARLVNLDEVPLNMLVKRVVQSYANTLPWMTRPQQQFFKGTNYLEITFDSHLYRYVARKTFHVFHPTIRDHIFDLAMVIEADKDEELPEQIWGCTRFVRLDVTKCVTIHQHYQKYLKGGNTASPMSGPATPAAASVDGKSEDGKTSAAAAAAAAAAQEVSAADQAEIDAALAEVEAFRAPATPAANGSTPTAAAAGAAATPPPAKTAESDASDAASPTAAAGTTAAAAAATGGGGGDGSGAAGGAKKKKKGKKKEIN